MEQALSTYLLATAGITALVVDRIDWGLRPQASALPAVSMNIVSRFEVDSDEGGADFYFARVQLECWALSNTAAKALGTLVRKAFKRPGNRLEQGLVVFENVSIENETDYQGDGIGGPVMYRASFDLLCNYHEHL